MMRHRWLPIATILAVFCLSNSLIPQSRTSPRTTTRPSTRTPAVQAISPLPIDQIVRTNSVIPGYHLTIEKAMHGMTQEGEVDSRNQRLFLRMTFPKLGSREATYYWANGKAYGQHAITGRWFRIKASSHFTDYLQGAVELIREGKTGKLADMGDSWKVEALIDQIPPRDTPETFYNALFNNPTDSRTQAIVSRLVKTSRGMKVDTYIWISKKDRRITKVTVETEIQGHREERTFAFSPSRGVVPTIPQPALRAPAKETVMPMLFLPLKLRQGWRGSTHRFLAWSALDLIRQKSAPLQYTELIDSVWGPYDWAPDPTLQTHPLISGSQFEDGVDDANRPPWYDTILGNGEYYFRNGWVRDFHHFGGASQGLQYQWFFALDTREQQPSTEVGNRFYSARDWAYGAGRIDENLNRMTFTQAITEYGNGSKKRAYLILGHVLHLLQDQAMPDHAGLLSHTFSSSTEEDAFNTIPFCELLFAAIEASAFADCGGLVCPLCAIPCAAVASEVAGVAYQACLDAYDPSEVGYERYVTDFWSTSGLQSRVLQTGIQKKSNYDEYFASMSAASLSAAASSGLSQPLGLETNPGAPFWPLEPSIDSDEFGAYQQLTDTVALPAICIGAGLLEYFYDIVNPPPFVQRFLVTQGDVERFRVEWVGSATPRSRVVKTNLPLIPGIPCTLKVECGPRDAHDYGRSMSTLTATAEAYLQVGPMGGLAPVDLSQSQVGTYTFTPGCSTKHINFKITGGKDKGLPHLAGRSPLGDSLDMNPQTVAQASSTAPYSWNGYETTNSGLYEEKVNVGLVDACWQEEEILSESCAGGWTFTPKSELKVRLAIYDKGSNTKLLGGGEQCGRYKILVPEKIHSPSGPRPMMYQAGGQDSSPQATPEGPYLSLSLDDPNSLTPVLTATYNGAVQSKESVTLHVPIKVVYEAGNGVPVVLCTTMQEVRIISDMAMINLCVKIKIAKMKLVKRYEFPWEQLHVGEEVTQTIDVERIAGAKAFPDAEREASQFALTRAVADPEISYIAPDAEPVTMRLRDANLKIRAGDDPRKITIGTSARTLPGMYFIRFAVQVGDQERAEFGLIVTVGR